MCCEKLLFFQLRTIAKMKYILSVADLVIVIRAFSCKTLFGVTLQKCNAIYELTIHDI